MSAAWPHDWSGARRIVHATSENLGCWQRGEHVASLSSERVIDAARHRNARRPLPRPCGVKGRSQGLAHLAAADSDDLYLEFVLDGTAGPVITDCAHESTSPNVFYLARQLLEFGRRLLGGGLGVYRSADAERYGARCENILEQPGNTPRRRRRNRRARRCLGVHGERALVFVLHVIRIGTGHSAPAQQWDGTGRDSSRSRQANVAASRGTRAWKDGMLAFVIADRDFDFRLSPG